MLKLNFVGRIRDLLDARSENVQLRDQIKELARFRNQLLHIVLTADEINHVNVESESLFVTLKHEDERITFQAFDHDLLRIASVGISVEGRYWNLMKEEISPRLPLSFKSSLLRHIESEAKRKDCILVTK